MNRFYRQLTLVLACLICIAASIVYIHFFPQKETGLSEIKVGYIYDGDIANPYTYNFAKAEYILEDKYPGKVESIVYSNIPEEKDVEYAKKLADAGCNIIFLNSYASDDGLKELALKYPDVQFCQAAGDNPNLDVRYSNYHTFMGSIYEARYITGVVAGMKLKEMIDNGVITTDDAKLGYIAAYSCADVISGYTAYYLGAASVVPEVTMEVTYTGSWANYHLEYDKCRALINDGCVIISHHTDTSGSAVACEDARIQGKEVYHIGYNHSMEDVAPTASLASCMINWKPYIVGAVEAVMLGKDIEKYVQGNIHGKDIGGGYSEGWLEITGFNELNAAPGTKEKIEELEDAFIYNRIKVFKGNYTGVNPDDPSDTIDLNNGYDECASSSAASFNYVLKGVIKIVE